MEVQDLELSVAREWFEGGDAIVGDVELGYLWNGFDAGEGGQAVCLDAEGAEIGECVETFEF